MKKVFQLSAVLFVVTLCAHLNADVIVIANNDISDAEISASTLQDVFLGKKRSLDSGDRVKPVTLKSGSSHESFLSNWIGKSPSQFSAFWKRKIVDGTGVPPKSFGSEDELVAYVQKTSGTIGYVSDQTDVSGVKTIGVN